ncbi:MAG: ribonuclease III domain-containing protein [Firmicutes bacterium]|nr:ribonuclease III domain-containing protein [Bacillota bacterium]
MLYSELNGLQLAYLGDAVIELMTRRRLLESGERDIGRLNELARKFVTATSQSDALENILPVLTEEEASVYRRGRNAHTATVPKSASAGQYRRATGMESLFAYLYLKGDDERLRMLFDAAFGPAEKSE